MAELKNYGSNGDKGGLKHADAEKSYTSPAPNSILDGVNVKLGDSIGSSVRVKKKERHVPVIVDVITGLLLIAVVIGIAVGAVYLFRYYTNDYEGVNVEYTFVCIADDLEEMHSRSLRNKSLYLDTEDNTLYFGNVVSAELYDLGNESGEKMLVVVVNANLKFKDDEGYSVNDQRIAVGSEYTLRSENVVVNGTIVELKQLDTKRSGGR
jgi:hypothetical protein